MFPPASTTVSVTLPLDNAPYETGIAIPLALVSWSSRPEASYCAPSTGWPMLFVTPVRKCGKRASP
jgi:hypothetical protein